MRWDIFSRSCVLFLAHLTRLKLSSSILILTIKQSSIESIIIFANYNQPSETGRAIALHTTMKAYYDLLIAVETNSVCTKRTQQSTIVSHWKGNVMCHVDGPRWCQTWSNNIKSIHPTPQSRAPFCTVNCSLFRAKETHLHLKNILYRLTLATMNKNTALGGNSSAIFLFFYYSYVERGFLMGSWAQTYSLRLGS
jgi:hypothetical protein